MVLLGGGIGTALALHKSSNTGEGTDTGSNGWDPNTLPSAADASGGITASDVQTVLDAKNRALKTGDRDLFTAPHSGSGQAAAGLLFDNLREVPFTKAEYQLLGQGSRSFQSAVGARQDIDIAFVHQITGVDVRPVAEWYRWTLQRPAPSSPVVITAVTGTPSVNSSERYVYYPGPWDAGERITITRRPGVVLAAVGDHDAEIVKALADDAEHAVAENLALWKQGGGPAGVSPGIFALGTSNRDAFYSWWSGKANQHGFEAGLAIEVVDAVSMDHPSGRRTVGGARIILDLTSSYFTGPSGQTNRKTLIKHEAWHALLYPLLTATFDSQPLWVVEGVADWAAKHDYPNSIAGDPNMQAARQLATGALGTAWDKHTLPTNAQVYAGSGAEMNAGYGLSTLAFHYIAATYGLAALVRFVVANYQVPADPSGINGADNLDAALRQSLGVDLTTFQNGWAGYVRTSLALA